MSYCSNKNTVVKVPLVRSVPRGLRPTRNHNASFQVFRDAGGGTRAVWIVDLLPDGLKDSIAAMIEEGLSAMNRDFDGAAAEP